MIQKKAVQCVNYTCLYFQYLITIFFLINNSQFIINEIPPSICKNLRKVSLHIKYLKNYIKIIQNSKIHYEKYLHSYNFNISQLDISDYKSQSLLKESLKNTLIVINISFPQISNVLKNRFFSTLQNTPKIHFIKYVKITYLYF